MNAIMIQACRACDTNTHPGMQMQGVLASNPGEFAGAAPLGTSLQQPAFIYSLHPSLANLHAIV